MVKSIDTEKAFHKIHHPKKKKNSSSCLDKYIPQIRINGYFLNMIACVCEY